MQPVRDLTQLRQERWIEFFGQRGGMVVPCDQPALMARTGEAISAVSTAESTFTGRAIGTAHDELWLARNTGMTLKWQRSVDTVADAAFGAKVRYQEEATFMLESIVPQT